MNGVILITADTEFSTKAKSTLRDVGIRISAECSESKSAIEAYQKNPDDIVIIDLFIAENSGFEILKSLKRMNENGNFLMLCRMRNRNALERAFRMGAQDVFHYPVAMEILRDTILRRLNAIPSEDREIANPAEQTAKNPRPR